MDKNNYTKQVKAGCRAVSKSVSYRKECENVAMCNWNMCQKEIIDKHNAMLTDEDKKSCENKDFLKQFACQEKLTKKKKLMDKTAMTEHCRANKCPQSKAFFDKMQNAIKNAVDSKFTNSSMDKCVNEKCAKETDEVMQLGNLENNKNYECKKTYKTWKEQTKCIAPYGKKKNKSINKLYKCRTKHCSTA